MSSPFGRLCRASATAIFLVPVLVSRVQWSMGLIAINWLLQSSGVHLLVNIPELGFFKILLVVFSTFWPGLSFVLQTGRSCCSSGDICRVNFSIWVLLCFISNCSNGGSSFTAVSSSHHHFMHTGDGILLIVRPVEDCYHTFYRSMLMYPPENHARVPPAWVPYKVLVAPAEVCVSAHSG